MSTTEQTPGSSKSEPQPADQTAAAPAAARPGIRGGKIYLALGILAFCAAALAGYWFFFMRNIVFSDDARLAGHMVDLAPEINDRLVDVLVSEGQFVRRGDEIFRLDSSAQEAALAQVEAAATSAAANAAVSEAGYQKTVNGCRPEEIRAAEATVKRLQNEEELARVEQERAEKLQADGASTRDSLDRARSAFASAQHSRENASETLAMLQKGSRCEDIDAAKADLDMARSRVIEAKAAITHARSDLDRCLVKAPFDGWVVRRWLDPGAMPLPGQPVVSLFDPSTLRVDANIEEKYLHRIHVGDEASIRIDAYPGLTLAGRVTQILRATNSQFSLIPSEGVSGTFIKVTQRVALRLSVEAPPELPLGPGLSAEVSIHAGSSRDH